MTKRTRKNRERGAAGTCAEPGMWVGDHPLRCGLLAGHDGNEHGCTVSARMRRESPVLDAWARAMAARGERADWVTWSDQLLPAEEAAALTAPASPDEAAAALAAGAAGDHGERMARVIERISAAAVTDENIARAMDTGADPDKVAASVNVADLLEQNPGLAAELDQLAAEARDRQ